ncbi:hypothetical protein [Paenibacillus mucilaginosus]|uniref:hypothetical protein n=1 Tax=Paenibacillus mucilaginosus TaxID=61624 RepID=UPI001180FCA1|nr:hypothetical protein [Paenibacillus mucilaginosus]MCG7213886.1 hypothetical protein [Paenibacillus mucilaginosus]WDM25892.1 hypothetical protein KCX80_26090 [Paenibacillus mucilaginosus]
MRDPTKKQGEAARGASRNALPYGTRSESAWTLASGAKCQAARPAGRQASYPAALRRSRHSSAVIA